MKNKLLLLSCLLFAGCSFADSDQVRDAYVQVPYDAGYDAAFTPHVYAIAATRATNKMLDETRDIYENAGNVFLYVGAPKKLDNSLPDGFHYAQKVTTEILEGSKDFKLVNNKEDADYYLEVLVDKAGNADVPVIVYKLVLFNNENVQVRSWTERVSRIRNDDRSWW